MRRRQALGLLASLAVGACNKHPSESLASHPQPLTRREMAERLGTLATEYERLMQEHGHLEWSRYAGKVPAGVDVTAQMTALRRAERALFDEALEIVNSLGTSLVTPREWSLWRRGALGLKLMGDPQSVELADELEELINDHRYERDGKIVRHAELIQLRRSDVRRERRLARRLESQLHAKAKPIAEELLNRRRALAKELGTGSFYVAMLKLRGIDQAKLRNTFAAINRSTRGAHNLVTLALRQALRNRPPAPWDLRWAADKIAKEPHERFPAEGALETALRIYDAFGIHLREPPLDVTVRDFAFGGQAIAVKVPSDVRLVVRPTSGARYLGTLLHELGHAYAAKRTSAEHPLYKGYEWVPGLTEPAFVEGVATVFGRLLDEPEVLRAFVGLTDEQAKKVVFARRVRGLLSLRRSIAWSLFEHAAHDKPDVDLDALSVALERQAGGVYAPKGTEPVWAASPFLATYPAYTQSYLLAAMMAVQVRVALKRRFGDRWASPEAGEFLTETLVADGARWTFDEKMIRATGARVREFEYARFLNGVH